MKKRMKALFCVVLCFVILAPVFKVNSNSKLEIRDTKPYISTEKVLKMDFDSVQGIRDYTDNGEWQVTTAASAVIKEGKLTCKAGSSFAIRTGFTLGDNYGLEKSSLSFDLSLTDGNIQIGTRLIKNTSTNSDTGIWFNVTGDSVKVSDVSSKLNETLNHGLNLSGEQKVIIEENLEDITLKIGDKTVCTVVFSLENLTVKDGSGNEIKSVKNGAVPYSGFARIDVNKLKGTIDNIEYIHRDISQTFPDAPSRAIDYSTWIATDDLDRVTPDNSSVGNVRDKYVGLFYFICHEHTGGGQVRDHTKIYLEQGLDALKKFLPTSPGGHWAEPYFGYYVSHDEWIYRKHAAQLTAAGVDFIFLDMSNALTYPENHTVLFDTWLKIRKEGGKTPQIVPMTGDMPSVLVMDMYTIRETIFGKPEYDELLFKWDGKPLILGNNDNPDGDRWTVSGTTPQTKEQFLQSIGSNKKVKEYYESGKFAEDMSKLTLRKSWAWQTRNYKTDKAFAGYWDWLDDWPQEPGRNFEGVIEQITVTMGTHAHTSKGRSFVDKNIDYGTGLEDFDFTLGKAKYGLCFEQQFKRAMEVNPQVMMITGWNEWYAGVQKSADKNLTTGHTKTPGYYLVDQFNPEFSRDGEPMKIRDGVGFGDNYYYQMVNYIREFKGIDRMPAASGQKTIDISKSTGEWSNVGPEFRDTLNDTAYRDHISWGGVYQYINNTGRNDFDYAKVSQDDNYLYFLTTTSNSLVTADETNWMNLFIDIDMDNKTGWEGYDYVLNRSRDGSKVSVEKFVNNSWEFEKVTDADYVLGEKSIAIKVQKSSLGISDGLASFDFKWADNSTTTGNVMQFMDLGDSAPDDRFNFRYYGSESSIPKSDKSKLNFFSNIFNPSKWTNMHIISFTVLFLAILFLCVAIVIKPKKKKN